MANLKEFVLSFLFCLLLQCAPSLQDCLRPNPGSNVIIHPDQANYAPWTYAQFSCPTGYLASSGVTYSYCYSGSPDYWSPAISQVISCTRDTSLTTPETGNMTAESMVFVADNSRGAIYMADFSSDSLDSLTFNALPFGSVSQPIGVDYDPDTRMVYWTETSGSIRRAKIDGTMQSVIVNSSIVGRSENLALDTSRGKVFWTDETLDRIMSANLDGSSQQILINTDLESPRAIIVHQVDGVMFWTDWSSPSRIERANLDGGDRYVIVNSSIIYPNGLALNAEGSRVYWCDAGTDKIESVDLWGNDRMVHLATSSIHPYDLAVVDDTIIWTDWIYDAIGVTSTSNGSGYSFYYHSTFQNPHGIHVYQEEMPTTTEVYNPTTYQSEPEPTTEDNRTPQPTWGWWTTDQPTTEDNRTPRPTWWWWSTIQPTTEDNMTPRPTWWWWSTIQPTPDGTHPTTVGWWDTTRDMPIDGEDVTLVVGVTQTISSPNYPSNYPNNVRYHWYITAPSGYDVLVQFLDFDLEGCCDYLTIGIGESPSSPGSVQLAKLSGSSLPSDMRLDSSKSWMRFTTDGSVIRRGFQLQLSLINSTTEPVTDDPWVPPTTWWWNNDPTTTESTTTGWWWWTTSYPGTTDTPRQPNETARLVNGSYPTEGRVEVYSGTWGTVCDHYWDTVDAGVLCRSIGYPDAIRSYGGAFYGMGTGPILLNHVGCSGHEESLFDCYHNGIGVHHCSHAEDAGAMCYPDARLVDGSSPSEGRVEVYYDGIWGTVCDHSWYSTNSHVVCRSLGFPGSISHFYDAYFGQGTGPILLNHVSCSGNEESIFDCSHNGVGNNHCSHSDDVGVRCQQNVRLVNGNSSSEGRVEVYHGDTWGTVCDHYWGNTEADVICRSLGYSSAESFYNAYFGQGSGDILLNHVSCAGNESSIFHCNHDGVGVNHCFHHEDVGVRCTDAEPTPDGPDPTTAGWWDTTRDIPVTEGDFCQGCCECGYMGGCHCDSFCQGAGDCCHDYVQFCANDSTTSPIQTEPPSADFTTSLIPTEAPSTVRLVNGNEAHEGRVEVYRSGSWGTICDDYWDINDARVVCRSLGYQDALSAPIQARFGQGSGPIWMDNVHCSGNEVHIFDCPHNGFGNHDCSHGEDASVVCLPDQADLTCDSVSMTLIMDRTLLEISDDARDVHFEDESCVGYDHDSQHVAITTMYDRCGTTQKQDDDYIIFTNMVTFYKPRPENGTNELITREHYLHIPVICYLERTQVLEESFLPNRDLYVPGEKGYGEFSLNLDRYTNSGFYQPANDSGEVTLGTPLYFGVRLTSVANLTLLIESCWATSSPNPRDDHRYDIIENGCAVDSTTVIYNWASSTFKRFSIDAFTFIGDYDKVYVHCSILICDNNDSGSRCAQGCLTRSRRSLQPTGSRSKPHTITIGPLSDAQRSQRAMLIDTIDDGPESHDPLVIGAVSALCVLIALTVIMALMMVRMRRRRPELTGYRRVGVTEQDY